MGCASCSKSMEPVVKANGVLPPREGGYMDCGHFITRAEMRSAISAQLNQGSSEFICPIELKSQQSKCNKKLILSECYEAAGFTQQQINSANEKLSMNEALKYTTNTATIPTATMATTMKNSQKEKYIQKKAFQIKKTLPSLKDQSLLSTIPLPKIPAPSSTAPTLPPLPLPKVEPLSNSQVKEQTKPQAQLSLKIKLCNSHEVNILVKMSLTIKKLKQIIFKDHYSELEPEQTILSFNGTVPNLQKVINSLSEQQKSAIIQRKAEIWEIPSLKTDKNKQDLVSCEVGVSIMSCKHEFGRQSMKALIKSQISSKEIAIKCPYKTEEGQLCDCQWDKKQWIYAAGFTDTEMQAINNKLNDNWIYHNTKKCPFCHQIVSVCGLNTRRVRCPMCNSKDFCFTCLTPWQNYSTSSCESDVCRLLRQKIANSPWEREFTLKRKNGKVEVVKTPLNRACPRCKNIIENFDACKHTRCICVNMEYSFCFVCLGLCEKQEWPCGYYNEYCGYVAPNQKFQ